VNCPGWCDYLTAHLAVKDEYDASMDPAEWDFAAAQLATCDQEHPVAVHGRY